MAKRGRPTKLNKELQGKICSLLRGGAYRKDACAIAGIDYSNFTIWMKKGENANSGIHADFYNAVKEAEAVARMTPSATLAAAAKHDPRWAKDWLIMRWPSDYNPQRNQKDTDDQRPIHIEISGLPRPDEDGDE